ncbi:PH domain-containing protein [Corynebacterium tapiri]|uniref:PH domain-containing protein n=1 Tax=Corynebacterium tapiri TaxID=1448266 RepID=A0A5C4U6Q6_9CORY|nr:PH domain-containing protein [Corynebacterium tapiri]TNL99792.1 PH domain-containing protein [Corynebacterium tapiri]
MTTRHTASTGHPTDKDHRGVFRPDRGHLIAAVLMLFLLVFLVGFAPLKTFWLFLFPALFIYWALKAHTTVDDKGISAVYAFRKGAHLPWEDVSGVSYRGSRALAEDKNGDSIVLPGVTFNSLPRLSEASRGRIPDPVTDAKVAADGKVEVIDRNGHSVLMTQEEYQAHQRGQH